METLITILRTICDFIRTICLVIILLVLAFSECRQIASSATVPTTGKAAR
jgi:hypothetical protein